MKRPTEEPHSQRPKTFVSGATKYHDLGITCFINSAARPCGKVKQRFSDFLVNEMDLEGNIIKITHFEPPVVEKEETVTVDSAELLAQLAVLIGQEQVDLLHNVTVDNTVTLKPIDDKSERGQVHQLIREAFLGKLDTMSNDEGCIQVMVKGSGLKNRFAKKLRSEHEYCLFHLYKENMESQNALSLIARTLKVPAKKFAIAGTKDKRGITVQQVTAHRMQPQQLLSVNQKLTNILVGNIRMVKEQLSLGQLSGNYFTVVVRELNGENLDIEARIKTFTDQGFINYFGLQRFGTRQVSTSDIGRLLLQSNWEQAIRSIMTLEGQSFEEQLLINAKDCPSDLFSKKAIAENALFNFLKENPGTKDYLGAIQRIPRNLKSMYLHSYQSLIWNQVVTYRIQRHGLSLVLGDLVKSNEKIIHLSEMDQLDQFTIYDLVLPLPGHAMEYPSNLKMFYQEALAKDGLDMNQMERPQKDFSLPGDYRHVFGKPINVQYECIKYEDPLIPLVLTDRDVFDKKELNLTNQGEKLALKISFGLKSSQYATMALRELIRDEEEILLQED